MSGPDFFVHDLVRGLLAFFAFAPVLFVPGYVAAWAVDLLGFRGRGAEARGALAVALSVALTPSATYLLARSLGFPAVFAFYGVAAAAFFALLARELRTAPDLAAWRWLPPRATVAAVLLWAVAALLLLTDFQLGRHLYPGIFAFDYAKHVSVTDAITRTGVPPANPSFFPGHAVELYYYYFWFLLCSVVDQLGGGWIGARDAVAAGTAWAGIALVAALALFLRFVTPRPAPRARVAVGVALLFVSGLDLIAALIGSAWSVLVRGSLYLYPTVEWWNEQVASWPNSVLWVPHHVAGLVALLTALLALRSLEGCRGLRQRAPRLLLCALALASAAGLSVWVTFAFAFFWSAWALFALATRRRAEAGAAVLAGVLALALALPYLLDLRRASQLDTAPIALAVRAFLPLDTLLLAHDVPMPVVHLLRLVFLPLNYLVELGFFALAGVLYWTRGGVQRSGRGREAAPLLLALAGLLVGSFLKASVRNNDLGWRSLMLAQFALLVWAIEIVVPLLNGLRLGRAIPATFELRLRPWQRRTLAATLVVGFLAVAYDLAMMRLYPMRDDLVAALTRGTLDGADRDGSRTYAVREAYRWMGAALPAGAVVQANPEVPEDFLFGNGQRVDVLNGLYADRQVAAADPEFGTLYGVPRPLYLAAATPITRLFRAGDGAGDAAFATVCPRYRIAALLVKDTDPVWRQPGSWAWRRTPLFANEHARVFACEAPAGPSPS